MKSRTTATVSAPWWCSESSAACRVCGFAMPSANATGMRPRSSATGGIDAGVPFRAASVGHDQDAGAGGGRRGLVPGFVSRREVG